MACEYHLLQVTHLTQVQLGVYDACYVGWMDAQPKHILIPNSRYDAILIKAGRYIKIKGKYCVLG